jgi:hypothetical protein
VLVLPRLLFFIAVIILVLMLCSLRLFWRRASVRVISKGFQFAVQFGRSIDVGLLQDIAANFSCSSVDFDDMITTAFE